MAHDADSMTIEALLAAAGNPPCTINTYLYVNDEDQVCAMEKADRASRPLDEVQSLGYAQRYMRHDGSPWPA